MSNNTPTPFCDRCNAVLLDDLKIGGSSERGDDGKESLIISAERYSMQYFPIDFQLNDTYPSLPALSNSAKGCRFCGFVKEAIVDHAPDRGLSKSDIEREIEIGMRYSFRANTHKMANGLYSLQVIIFEKGNEGQKLIQAVVECHIESAPGPCADWLRLSINRPGNVLRPDTISWIQNNIDSTAESFSKAIQSNGKFIPTRLVRVDCQPPRLIETPHGFSHGSTRDPFRYAAISYCWGTPEHARSQLKTEKSSLSSRLSSIEEDDMNQVLRDAVQTCRALAIPYLWIDTLCIIQDDPQDWIHESSLLGKIYANAYLTICALSSDSCNGSFLTRAPAKIEIPFSSKVKPSIHGSYSLKIDSSILFAELPNTDIETSIWEKRAWTFQEKLMSLRMLAFNKYSLHFISPWRTQTQYEKIAREPYTFQMALLGQDEYHTGEYHLLKLWYHDVCPRYAERMLTYEKDRFPALSGIAQRFSKLLDDEYVAGLWKGTLYRGLYWNCLHDPLQSWDTLLDQFRDTSEYVAPSWSWVIHRSIKFGYDINCMFQYESRSYWRKCSNIEVDVVMDGADPFGRIKRASLRITAQIRPLPADREVRYSKDRMIIVQDSEGHLAYCITDWDPNASTEPWRETMMLLLGTTEDEADLENSGDNTRSAFGLLIHPVPETDKYFRVGIFYSEDFHQWSTRLFGDCPERTVMLV
ncbi:HET-domain-containing protein [Annulohypoxylon moriforme]|nr:HET-domain-containing protein [Annulohypoxylon moriforme]